MFDLLFTIFNNSILLPWGCMVFLPRWRFTQWLLRYPVFPLAIAGAYTLLAIWGLCNMPADGAPGGNFFSLEGVTALFSRKEAVLVGWLHYLAFDLWVGTWELRDSQRLGIAHYWVAPCLVLTLMLGPIGFLLYQGLRFWKGGAAADNGQTTT